MTTTQIGEPSPRKLRLWPGIALLVLLFVFRFGVKALVPGIGGFGYAVLGSLGCMLAILLWWLIFSRARWVERLGAIGVMAASVGALWFLKHDTMWLQWLFAYAVPLLALAFVTWAVVTRRLTGSIRLVTMVATIVVACGVWLFVRQDGMNGDHNASFGWRWSQSAEERLLAQAPEEPAAPATAPSSSESPASSTSASPSASVAPATEAPKEPTAPAAPVSAQAEWPGFRGPRRDGIVRGVKIKTDWSASPPAKIWRRAIGPGWSSFAVSGDLLYTQEQRGEEEVVACYKATTGQPVWSHRDKARFFESVGGAGPRGTPTLHNGRVYAFGATGILNALDAATGKVLWSRNVASETKTEIPFWGFSSSPLVIGDAVIVAASGNLVAYDAATGNQKWVGPKGGGSYSSPHLVTIDGVAQVLLVNGSGVVSIAPADGKQMWDHQWAGVSIVQPALGSNGEVLIAGQENGTRSLAVGRGSGGWTAKERWTSNGLKPYFNDFVVHKGHAFGFDNRILSCIDLKDGQRKWKGGRYGNGQLILLPDQDLLLVLSEEGELALVGATPDQFAEVAKVPGIQGKTWNHPALVGDILLVRNGEEMAAFRLPRAN
ncbi:MAG TPA: PQQ-binding-like beta-propeller repeat protein [Pyrinomonadaceae bacterium]|nr:PQQ-binding-like beta-propeller repeat protein [Pyrinomonadaceae bacterium]